MIRPLLLLGALFLTSCGSSYHSAFQKARKQSIPKPSVEGAWKGTWKSKANGHHGPLWCIVSQNEKDQTLWDFRYRAGWGILQFGDYLHQVPAKLDRHGNLPIKGSMTLPNNFGTYSVNGQLTPGQFNLRYKGSGDHGTMTLSRP
ncbi:MAG: hypothetical protein ACON5H_06225 [Akkermansiaceae bacterium]